MVSMMGYRQLPDTEDEINKQSNQIVETTNDFRNPAPADNDAKQEASIEAVSTINHFMVLLPFK